MKEPILDALYSDVNETLTEVGFSGVREAVRELYQVAEDIRGYGTFLPSSYHEKLLGVAKSLDILSHYFEVDKWPLQKTGK